MDRCASGDEKGALRAGLENKLYLYVVLFLYCSQLSVPLRDIGGPCARVVQHNWVSVYLYVVRHGEIREDDTRQGQW